MGRAKGNKNIDTKVIEAIVYFKKILPKFSPRQIFNELKK